MKTYCPYPDCLQVYEIDAPNENILFNSQCPDCDRLVRVKALEIVDKLKAREKWLYSSAGAPDLLKDHGSICALLEDIRSLWNVGSIFRSADATGISKLYLTGITGCPPRDEISKTALGAEQDIPWAYSVHTLNVTNPLKKAGITIVGLERNDTSIDLFSFLKEGKLKSPVCVAVGNEVKGLSPELMQACDYICHLPMKGKKESLNVASAFTVAAYAMDQFIHDTTNGAKSLTRSSNIKDD